MDKSQKYVGMSQNQDEEVKYPYFAVPEPIFSPTHGKNLIYQCLRALRELRLDMKNLENWVLVQYNFPRKVCCDGRLSYGKKITKRAGDSLNNHHFLLPTTCVF